ncbi:MAG: hypothetical protein ACXWQO_15250 [Bdellovibrionota bacterium]
MNYAHIHLVLNHIPVVGIPIALLFLAHGFFRGNQGTQRIALVALVAIAALTVPIYFTGEPAEKVVEHLPGVAESFIEAHEDAAEVSIILTTITGVLAVGALWLWRSERFLRYALLGTMSAAAIAAASLGYTANLGGKIRHTEIRSDAVVQSDGANR